jgi:hypothetical protein
MGHNLGTTRFSLELINNTNRDIITTIVKGFDRFD